MFVCCRFILLFAVAYVVAYQHQTVSAFEHNVQSANEKFDNKDATDVVKDYFPLPFPTLDGIQRKRQKRETLNDDVSEVSSQSTLPPEERIEQLTIKDLAALVQSIKEEVKNSINTFKNQYKNDNEIREAIATKQMQIINDRINEVRAMIDSQSKTSYTPRSEMTDSLEDKYTTVENAEVTENTDMGKFDVTNMITVESFEIAEIYKYLGDIYECLNAFIGLIIPI